MNGKAPKFSAIGSHTRVTKKLRPNLSRASEEPFHSAITSMREMSTRVAAKRKVMTRAISSPSRSRERKEREPATGLGLGTLMDEVATPILAGPCLLYFADGLQLFVDNFLGQFGVGKILGEVLPVGNRPLYEALQGVALGRVLELFRNQQPSEASNRIGALTWSIGDRDAEILRYGFYRASGSFGHAGQIRLHESAGRVLDAAVGNLVLCRINQFNVANGIRGLFDQTSDAFIAFAT